jgi:hypothetical protein
MPKKMHPIVRDEVCRIGYETIRNARTHSEASRLEVELRYADDLTLLVSDIGTGDKNDHLDGRDFHDPESFVTGLVHSLDLLPPEIENGENTECGREIIRAEVKRMLKGSGAPLLP